jgi:hypothetical protein
LFTLCTLLKAIICCLQLNTQWLLGQNPEGGLLVTDAVGLWSMYYVVMPIVNLIVILMTFVCLLYSINCPNVICLPIMLFTLWRDTTSELWTRSIFLYCYYRLPFTHFIYILANYYLLPLDTFNPLFIEKPVRLTTSL